MADNANDTTADNANDMTADNANDTTTTGADNKPKFRAQRLYLKVQNCMKFVNKILADERKTTIPTWLSGEKLETFRSAVRSAIRLEFDTTMDSWPQRRAHNYLPDAQKVILKTGETEWDMFVVDGYDDFVLSEIVFDAFYKD